MNDPTYSYVVKIANKKAQVVVMRNNGEAVLIQNSLPNATTQVYQDMALVVMALRGSCSTFEVVESNPACTEFAYDVKIWLNKLLGDNPMVLPD